MNKEELKTYIKTLALDAELQQLAFEMIDNASEANQQLLDSLADLLNAQADFHEQAAEALGAEADVYENLSADIKELDAEEDAQRAEATAKNQENVLTDIKATVSIQAPPPSFTPTQ